MPDAPVVTPDPAPVIPPVDAPSLPTEVEHDGRIFAGVGATEESLKQTIADQEARRDATEPVSEPVQPAGKPRPVHKRIAELTAERDEGAKQLNTALDQVQALTKRLEALEQGRQSTPQPAAPEPPSVPRGTPAPVPSQTVEEPRLETFLRQIGQPNGPADWDEAQQQFAKANNDYILQAVSQVVGQQQAQQQTAQTFVGMKQRGTQKYPDFEAKIGAMDAYPIFPVEMQRAAVGRPNAEDIWYRWATDPFFALQSVSAFNSGNAQEFDRMLSSVAPVSAPSVPAASPAPTIVVPPPPMQPVGGASPTQARSLDDLAARGGEDYDSSGWRERRAQDRKGGRLR